MQIPTLETQRLTLRENRLSDFEPLVEFYADPIRSAGFGGVLNRNDAWRWLASSIGHWQLRGYGFWTVEEKATGLFAGMVGLWSPEGWREPELGWILAANAEGRGIAYEAALAARTYTYDVMGWDTLTSNIIPGTTRSIALAERLGAKLDGSYHNDHMGGEILVYRHPSPAELDNDGNVEAYK
jgi:RimJ/RimL family protein N-acetyltransferase